MTDLKAETGDLSQGEYSQNRNPDGNTAKTRNYGCVFQQPEYDCLRFYMPHEKSDYQWKWGKYEALYLEN